MTNHHKFANSTSIDACDYDDAKNILIVHFASGSTYHYPDCPKAQYDALKQAASVGKHFHQHIKRFKAVKVK